MTLGEWRRLSPWAIAHFAQKAILQNLQFVVIALISAYFGTSRMRGPDGGPAAPEAPVFVALARAGAAP